MSSSINVTYFVLLFIVFLASFSCNARLLDDVSMKTLTRDHSQITTTKHNEKSNVGRVSSIEAVETSSSSLQNKSDDEEIITKKKRSISSSSADDADDEKTNLEVKEASGPVSMKGINGKSLTWKLPKKKQGEKQQPGFNLDYAPPKVHPPHHN